MTTTTPECLKLTWSDPSPACEEVRYDHVIAKTPFGRILITWKSWKKYDSPTVGEHPVDGFFYAGYDVKDAQLAAERAYFEAIAGSPATAPGRHPLADEHGCWGLYAETVLAGLAAREQAIPEGYAAVPINALSLAVITLAHASSGNPLYDEAYNELSGIIEAHRKGQKPAAPEQAKLDSVAQAGLADALRRHAAGDAGTVAVERAIQEGWLPKFEELLEDYVGAMQETAVFNATQCSGMTVRMAGPRFRKLMAHVQSAAALTVARNPQAAPVQYRVGNEYQTQSGEWVRFVGVANEGTSYECMCDESGVYRYTRRDFGRVTGSAHDYSDQRNTPPLYATIQAAPEAMPQPQVTPEQVESARLGALHEAAAACLRAAPAGAEREPYAACARAVLDLGGDNLAAPEATIDQAFVANLARSRAKYPNNRSMLDGLCGELHELKRAYSGDGDVRAEAFDVAVCAYRLAVEGDAGGNQKLGLIPDSFAWGATPETTSKQDEPTDREALIASLEDDAAKLSDANPDDEMAQTMREAAAMLEAGEQMGGAQVATEQPSKITDTASARAFVDAWHRKHFPTDRTFTRYIMNDPSRSNPLAGDFAWQLANALESFDKFRAAEGEATSERKPPSQAMLQLHAKACEFPQIDMSSYDDDQVERLNAWGQQMHLRVQTMFAEADFHYQATSERKPLTEQKESGAVYGIIDPDYGRIYTIVRTLAWQEGYAIGLHGSFTRDLDLIAVPWEEGRRCDPEKLVRRIVQATGLSVHHNSPGAKPHGRKVWTLLLPEFGDPRFVDLSIFPTPTIEQHHGIGSDK